MSLSEARSSLHVKLAQSVCLLCFLLMSLGCVSGPTGHVVKRSQMLMGTFVFVTAVAPDEQQAQRAAAGGLAEIRRLEELWSTWIPTSELSRVNQEAGKGPVQVSPETMELLVHSLEIARLTDGGFSITIGPAVNAWNVSQEGRIPDEDELALLKPLVDISHLRLDQAAGTVMLTETGMQLDVGGIGKGFAADFAATVMREQGATAGVVALSGDIKTFGRMPDDQRFVFGIQHPRQETGILLARLELENEAVSTAGDYQRFFMRNGVRYHHILDPKTLQPARGVQSVTVVAKEGVIADGLDTGIFVMGREKGMALIERLPDVEGVIVDEDGGVWVSSGLQDRVVLENGGNP